MKKAISLWQFIIWSYKINKNVESALSKITGKGRKASKKKCLVVDDYIINKVLDKIKGIINIKISDDTKISIDTSECCKRLWKCCDINYVRY